ncbi:ribosomal oxygenase 1 [Hippocampus comes]|uniref:Bifunctional lysine-specific demethylase and histidyl-hydroxylase n=1 Tax=Hippocampus comes TaxID=109280 RepID=A0A3Q2YER7_HIPCM|nr:PREDICTED: bifunctional lysine-specific demethylase and histidyl-hydroxylase NO66 [Hippocampus comes]
MERKHMSAFSMYQTLPTQLPSSPKKRSLQTASKRRKRGNDVASVNSNNIATQSKKKKMKAKNHAAEVGIQEVAEPECVKAGEEALNVLLAELAQMNNSKERASTLFQWLISPIPTKAFFRETWEKKPVLVQRKNPNYYKGIFSTEEFDRILRQEDVQYGVNLDVTSYTDGKRETHNPPGRALPYTVWDFYENGCSLRMLNPQAFSSTVWNVLSILQEHFGSMAGANVYLTPPDTQGFAPHYDDIEAFVIQLEGKKHWRVYNPRSDDEVLPVLSSPNFNQAEIGKPILEVVLEAGDLLYFPRGFIHQGDCLPDVHSLHITISSYQKNSWGDLLLKMVPTALEIAMEEDVEFRQGLPLDYLSYMGVQNSDKDDPRRAKFFSKIDNLMNKLSNFVAVDAAVDLKAREFLHDCLPPKLTADEAAGSVHGAPARWEEGRVRNAGAYITSQTRVALLRAGCARLCSDGDAVHLYYTTDNSRVYHKEEPKSFEIKPEYTDAVEFLIHSYPEFVSVGSFPCDSLQEKMSLAKLLFKEGVIRMESFQ